MAGACPAGASAASCEGATLDAFDCEGAALELAARDAAALGGPAGIGRPSSQRGCSRRRSIESNAASSSPMAFSIRSRR